MTGVRTPSEGLIQLTQTGLLCSASDEVLEALRAEFDRLHCIRLRQFVEPGLLTLLQRHIERAEFYNRVHEGIGVELCMVDNAISAVLHFLTNRADLFRAAERITGCGGISSFEGRVYRMASGTGHYDSWHGDVGGQRMIGMSVNLSTEIFSGGVFQLREIADSHILYEMANTGFGDAILFRISRRLCHRVTPMEGDVTKTAFAGWFKPQPPLHPLLRRCAEAESRLEICG
jgi:hypothetical protein